MHYSRRRHRRKTRSRTRSKLIVMSSRVVTKRGIKSKYIVDTVRVKGSKSKNLYRRERRVGSKRVRISIVRRRH